MSPDDRLTERPAKHRHLIWLGVFAGLVLVVIGGRFLIDPRAAQHMFGLAKGGLAYELHAVVGLRDLWLGLIAIILASLKEWRAMAVWFGLGAVVCAADSAIVAATTGKLRAIAFHIGSGVFCGWLALACWRTHRRAALPSDSDATKGPPVV